MQMPPALKVEPNWKGITLFFQFFGTQMHHLDITDRGHIVLVVSTCMVGGSVPASILCFFEEGFLQVFRFSPPKTCIIVGFASLNGLCHANMCVRLCLLCVGTALCPEYPPPCGPQTLCMNLTDSNLIQIKRSPVR